MIRKYITIFCILFACVLIADVYGWVGPAQLMMSQGGIVGGGPAAPDVFYESYNSAGYDNSWVESVGGTNVMNEDFGSGYDGQGLDWDVNDDTENNQATTTDFTEQTGEIYFTFRIYCVDGGDAWDDAQIFNLLDDTLSAIYITVTTESACELDIYNDDTVVNDVSISSGSWDRVTIKYNSDGSSTSQYKINGGEAQDIGAEANNRDPDNLTFGALAAGLGDTFQFYIDDIGICTAPNASDCGW